MRDIPVYLPVVDYEPVSALVRFTRYRPTSLIRIIKYCAIPYCVLQVQSFFTDLYVDSWLIDRDLEFVGLFCVKFIVRKLSLICTKLSSSLPALPPLYTSFARS